MEQEHRIEWELPDFERRNNTIIKSFSLANCLWRFQIRYNTIVSGISQKGEAIFQLHLLEDKTDPCIIGIEYKIRLKYLDNDKIDLYRGSKLYNTSADTSIININNRFTLITSDSLAIQVPALTEIVIRRFYTKSLNNSTSKTNILFDLEKLLEDSMYSDVTLRTSKKDFKAHKSILAKRSIVFDRMFRCNMKEKVSNVVEMNVCPFILEEFLHYIYCDKVNNLEKYANELLKLAHMYEVQSLSILCYAGLCMNLTTENVVKIFLLGNDYQIDNLKLPVIDFIIDHIDKIINYVDFDKITQNPQLTKEIFQRLSDRKQTL